MNDSVIDHFNEKADLISTLTDILASKIEQNQWEQIEKDSSNIFQKKSQQFFLSRKFVLALCASCNGNIYNVYKSFDYILHTKNLKELNEIQIYLSQYKEIYCAYGSALNNAKLEHQNLLNKVQNELFLSQEIEKEYEGLSESNSQINNKYKELSKIKVNSVKTNQLIISDLIYLIDFLNRNIKK